MHFTSWAFLAFLPSGPEWLYIGVLFVLLFGADKLPQFARGLGRTLGEFKRAKEEMEEELRRATEEDTRPRIRPRPEGDDEAMPASPKTLPVTAGETANPKAALPSPDAAAQPEMDKVSDTQNTAGTATTAASTTTAAPDASATPILRPVTTAVAFGSARRSTPEPVPAPAPAAPSAAVQSNPYDEGDDFDMPTTQLDDDGRPVSPFIEDETPAAARAAVATAVAEDAKPQHHLPPAPAEEDDTNRRPSSFVL